MTKINKFEYIIHQLVDWYKENKSIDDNDLSKLKILKLHFFVCSASSLIHEKNNDDLFNHFDKFVAMPYGHVEEDVYNFILQNRTSTVQITDTNLYIKSTSPNVEEKFESLVKDSIDCLKNYNKDIIFQETFRLVELSHNWFSWKYYFNSARMLGRLKSYNIPIDVLREENKYFVIQNEKELSPSHIG